jgi:hypothetical protein
MARPNILDRFRPVGAPGPAGPVGVPAVDDQGVATELAPVFAALAPDVQACTALVDEARQEADAALSQARELAAAAIAQARLDAGADRARAAAAVEQVASEQDAQLLDAAVRQADALQEAGTALLPATVRRVIDAMLAEYLAPPS